MDNKTLWAITGKQVKAIKGLSETVEIHQALYNAMRPLISDNTPKTPKNPKKDGGINLPPSLPAAITSRVELMSYLSQTVKAGNAQAAKLYADLEGYAKADQDITLAIIDYSDAPDAYQASKRP